MLLVGDNSLGSKAPRRLMSVMGYYSRRYMHDWMIAIESDEKVPNSGVLRLR